MIRLQDWQSRFAQLVRERKSAPFVWGTHDCCLWAADSVLALTGEDFAADLRGTYSTALEASKVLERLGGVRAIADSALGETCSLAMLTLGDIVCVSYGGRESLAVCNGQHVLVTAPKGLQIVGFDSAVCAWKV